MYEVPDAVPHIHCESYHVATDKDPSKFRSIFSDNRQPIATRGKIARGTLLVDIGCSSERAHPSVIVIATKLAAAIYGGAANNKYKYSIQYCPEFASASLPHFRFWTTQLLCLCPKTVELFTVTSGSNTHVDIIL